MYIIFAFLPFTATAYAGGAVAATQQRKMQQQQGVQQQMIMQRQAVLEQQRQTQPGQPSSQNPGGQPEEVAEVVSLEQLWKSFDSSSEGWALIMDPQAKVVTVAKFIELYRQKKITIRKSPVEYTQIIDDMAQNNPEMLKNPFERILMIVAIIEYDFDNGQDKDQMALQILGKQGFMANKQRLGLK